MAFVEVLVATSEQVSVGVTDVQFVNTRHTLPAHEGVLEVSSNNSWLRDMGVGS